MEVKKVSELQEIANAQQAVIPCVDGEGNAKKVPASKLGISTIKAGIGAYAEVFNGLESDSASGESSHAEGESTVAEGDCSHAEGYSTRASGVRSHAEGDSTVADGDCSHAEGDSTVADGVSSHAEGESTVAEGDCSHAEGYSTRASGVRSHAEGDSTAALGDYSHAEGNSTVALHEGEHAEGKYNKSNNGTISSIGIGSSTTNRKNAFEVMDNGNIYVYGLGGYDGTNARASGIKTLQQILTNS